MSEFFVGEGDTVNAAQIWARDPEQLDPLLVQARAVSFGLENLRFVTVDGIRSLVGQAAGIVIALLIAFSLVARRRRRASPSGATARADVQRRLAAIGVMRAVGISRAAVDRPPRRSTPPSSRCPPRTSGSSLGALVAYGPSARLLGILNELPPGAALLLPLAGCLLGSSRSSSSRPSGRRGGRPGGRRRARCAAPSCRLAPAGAGRPAGPSGSACGWRRRGADGRRPPRSSSAPPPRSSC